MQAKAGAIDELVSQGVLADVTDTTSGCEFSINLIPHTRAVTTLGQLTVGRRVNLEVDLLARYAERIVSILAPAMGKRT